MFQSFEVRYSYFMYHIKIIASSIVDLRKISQLREMAVILCIYICSINPFSRIFVINASKTSLLYCVSISKSVV